MSNRPKRVRVFTGSGLLVALAMALGALLGIVGPSSAQFFNFGGLMKSGVPALQTAKIKGFVPIGRSDRASLYDESLPPGLILIE